MLYVQRYLYAVQRASLTPKSWSEISQCVKNFLDVMQQALQLPAGKALDDAQSKRRLEKYILPRAGLTACIFSTSSQKAQIG